MIIIDTFHEAIRNVLSNKLRTFLTMLGIIIGVMAVIVIVGLGNGMSTSMTDQFSEMGTDTLTVSVMGFGFRSASIEDIEAIVDEYPQYFSKMSPTVSMNGSVKVGTTSYSSTSVSGVNEEYFDIKDYSVSEGRKLNYIDMETNKRVCVIGDYINRVAFGGNGIGQTIKVGSSQLTIVGVMAAEVDETDDQEGSTDDCIYLPYTTAMRISRMSTANSYTIQLTDENLATEGKEVMENGLYKLFNSDDGYTVISMTEILDIMNTMINMVVTVLTAIAALSLLVGGIGIMNIMTVSVTERTREIGIRKALGAKERIILMLFVIEAAVTSALGGIIGIILGFAVSKVATSLLAVVLTDVTLTVTPTFSSIMVAFSISVGIGVLFGYLPAKRAARLNPIDALRDE